MGKFMAFALGGAIGTAVGAGVSALLAPQRGSALQDDVQATLQEAREAGDRADVAAREEFRRRYRERVGDPDALQQEEPA